MSDKNAYEKAWVEKLKDFYDRLESHNKQSGYDSDIAATRKFNSDIVLTSMKYCFLINAGALVALPPLITALTKSNVDEISFSASVVSYIFGIMCSFIGFVAAAMSTSYDETRLKEIKSSNYYRALNGIVNGGEDSETLEKADASDKKAEELSEQIIQFAWLAAGSCGISVVLFVVGCLFFLY